eukprot:Opistho-2@88375
MLPGDHASNLGMERAGASHLQLVLVGPLLVVLVVVLFVIIGLLLGLLLLLALALSLLTLLALLLVNLVLHLLLALLRLAPRLLGKVLGGIKRVRHKHIVENGARLDLPEVKSNVCVVLIEIELRILDIVGVGDLGVDPLALVCGVVDHACLPLALVVRIVNHRRLPLAIALVVPVLGLARLGIGNKLGGGVPVGGLRVLGVGDLLAVVPVRGLLGAGVQNLLRGKEVPVLLKRARLDLLEVNVHLVLVVGVEDESVDVAEFVVLAADLLLDEVVLALVVEDHVHLLGAGAANVGSEHNVVLRITIELLLLERRGEDLDVAAAAVDLLLVLDLELNHKVLVLVGGSLGELGRDAVKARILAGLDALVSIGIAVKLAGSVLPRSHVRPLRLRLDPSRLPVGVKGLLEKVSRRRSVRDAKKKNSDRPHLHESRLARNE